jgi:hypothetical protein
MRPPFSTTETESVLMGCGGGGESFTIKVGPWKTNSGESIGVHSGLRSADIIYGDYFIIFRSKRKICSVNSHSFL